jgi:hypothetical protein
MTGAPGTVAGRTVLEAARSAPPPTPLTAGWRSGVTFTPVPAPQQYPPGWLISKAGSRLGKTTRLSGKAGTAAEAGPAVRSRQGRTRRPR